MRDYKPSWVTLPLIIAFSKTSSILPCRCGRSDSNSVVPITLIVLAKRRNRAPAVSRGSLLVSSSLRVYLKPKI